PVRLEQYGITSDELSRAIVANNRLVPAGELEASRGRFSVKVPGLIENAQDLLNLPLKATSSGTVLLKDVADVRRTFKDPVGFNSVEGQLGIAIQVSKRTEANDIEVVNAVRAVVEAERPEFPHGVEVGYTADMSEFTLSMVSEMQGNIIAALLLVMTIVVGALGLRSGIIVGFGIPFSLLFSLVVISIVGFSFNMMVMFGMLLALGMLIDGAIVIAEFADRKMAEGMSAQQAYATAVRRMFWPVTASTGTTLAAFLPIMFWPGVSGEFMRYLPVTVFAVLTGSLLYALLFAPVIGSVLPRFMNAMRRLFRMPEAVAAKDQEAKQYLRELEGDNVESLGGFTGAYARLLANLVSRVGRSALAGLFMLIAIFFLYGEFNAGVDFFGESEPKYATVNIRAQGNLSVAETRELVQEVERIILAIPGVLTTTASSTGNSIFGGGGERAKDQVGEIVVELADARDLESGTALSVIYEIRDRTVNIPGIKVGVDIPEGGPPVGRPINVQLESNNREALITEARRLRQHMESNI